jgi:hypothetical protein
MIESLRIENFRCFKALELHGLKRINAIVGDNATGKTVLLEAIRIGLAGTPGIIPWINNSRGLVTLLIPNPTREQFESQWGDLFCEWNSSMPILISVQDSQGRTAAVQIFYNPSKAVTAQSRLGGEAEPSRITPSTIIPLAFQRTHFSGEESTLYATVNPQGGQLLEPGPELGPSCAFFSNTMFGFPPENASWFSKLSIDKRAREVVEAFRHHFDYVENLSTETLLPYGQGVIYADLPHLLKKIPVSLVSAGMNRLLSFILAVVTFGEGVVLIDEVENGIFYNQFLHLWETLVNLVHQHHTQLFVTTHSLECLRASVPLIKENPDDFCLLRADRKGRDKQPQIQKFDGTQFGAALDNYAEIRSR